MPKTHFDCCGLFHCLRRESHPHTTTETENSLGPRAATSHMELNTIKRRAVYIKDIGTTQPLRGGLQLNPNPNDSTAVQHPIASPSMATAHAPSLQVNPTTMRSAAVVRRMVPKNSVRLPQIAEIVEADHPETIAQPTRSDTSSASESIPAELNPERTGWRDEPLRDSWDWPIENVIPLAPLGYCHGNTVWI